MTVWECGRCGQFGDSDVHHACPVSVDLAAEWDLTPGRFALMRDGVVVATAGPGSTGLSDEWVPVADLDPIRAEILRWMDRGSPDVWPWPSTLNPWRLVAELTAALAAVLDVHDPDEVGMCNGCWWESKDVDNQTPMADCEVRKAIATALGVAAGGEAPTPAAAERCLCVEYDQGWEDCKVHAARLSHCGVPTNDDFICTVCGSDRSAAEQMLAGHQFFGSGGSQWCDTCGEAETHPIHNGEGDR